jgi:hypothetical protein
MNAELLLQHFNRISEAPDAVTRLRRFVLDLAVRGKLVKQDPNDEPLVERLKHIQAGNGLGRKGEGGAISPKPNEIWSIPASWCFLPLEALSGDSGVFSDGDWVESKDQDPNGGVRLVQLADVGNLCAAVSWKPCSTKSFLSVAAMSCATPARGLNRHGPATLLCRSCLSSGRDNSRDGAQSLEYHR